MEGERGSQRTARGGAKSESETVREGGEMRRLQWEGEEE